MYTYTHILGSKFIIFAVADKTNSPYGNIEIPYLERSATTDDFSKHIITLLVVLVFEVWKHCDNSF